MKVPFSFLPEQFSNPDPIFAQFRDFLKRCDFTLGEDLEVFEKTYAAFCGTKHAIGVGTGTDALFLSLKIAGVQPGDEVITAPNSFIATTGAVAQAGAIPVYVDVAGDQTIDCQKIERAITKKTKAILPVHWAGAPADMETICSIGKQYNIPVVEDACQALGAKINGKPVGSFGLTAGFSVHPMKPLHVWGDGGIIVTNSDEINTQLRLLRNHGLSDRDTVAVYGYNCRFDNLQAIVGNYLFKDVEPTIQKRIDHAERFDKAFRTERFGKHLQTPQRMSGRRHVFHLYILYVQERDKLLRHLNAAGVEAKIHYPIPLHLQPAAKVWNRYKQGDFPETERQSTSTITLPCHQFLNTDQIDFAIDKVAEFYGV